MYVWLYMVIYRYIAMATCFPSATMTTGQTTRRTIHKRRQFSQLYLKPTTIEGKIQCYKYEIQIVICMKRHFFYHKNLS